MANNAFPVIVPIASGIGPFEVLHVSISKLLAYPILFVKSVLVELKKSHGPDDNFYRYQASKKKMKEMRLDLDIVGKFANGDKWTRRTGTHTVQRLNRACIKYLGEPLDLKEDPCKLSVFFDQIRIIF